MAISHRFFLYNSYAMQQRINTRPLLILFSQIVIIKTNIGLFIDIEDSFG